MEVTPGRQVAGTLPRLAGLSVLIVEDDYFIAQDVATQLRREGATVLGPVADVTRARALAAGTTPGCALLDINLKGELVFELAQELVDRGVPSIFTTGYDASILPPTLRSSSCLRKPVSAPSLIQLILERTLRRRVAG